MCPGGIKTYQVGMIIGVIGAGLQSPVAVDKQFRAP